MPVHNAGTFLKAAVDSILQQIDVTFELLIIDDHSDDGAINALADDPLITILTSPKRGIVEALNIGIKAAKYPYISRMDADDISDPNRLSTQLNHFINNPDLDICACKVKMFNPVDGISDGYLHYETWINSLCNNEDIKRDFFIESPIPHPTAMLRREYLVKLGGYIDSDWPEDYDLWFRALLSGAKFGKPTGETIFKWRDHSQRLSRTDPRYSKQMFLQCKAHYLSIYLQRRGISKCMILGSGPTGLKMHDYLCEKDIQVEAFIDVDQKLIGRSRREKIIHITTENATNVIIKEFIAADNSILVSAVSVRGGRQKIRLYLQKLGLSESSDYIIAA